MPYSLVASGLFVSWASMHCTRMDMTQTRLSGGGLRQEDTQECFPDYCASSLSSHCRPACAPSWTRQIVAQFLCSGLVSCVAYDRMWQGRCRGRCWWCWWEWWWQWCSTLSWWALSGWGLPFPGSGCPRWRSGRQVHSSAVYRSLNKEG